MTIRESMGIVRICVVALGVLIGCSVDPIRTEMLFKAKSEVAIIMDYQEENRASPESDIIRKRIASLVQAQLIERGFRVLDQSPDVGENFDWRRKDHRDALFPAYGKQPVLLFVVKVTALKTQVESSLPLTCVRFALLDYRDPDSFVEYTVSADVQSVVFSTGEVLHERHIKRPLHDYTQDSIVDTAGWLTIWSEVR
ncbi:MAG TPA: DUF4136 domain-containing protein [Leptospiraceae bacterium]|nr:DUF4136 domain-containing protein [Leptospirales bacterium]HMU84359.1 DUF4136 domain-containing protein [Leptospiraceae bacterium]HMX56067.1 DUF4136 domain-containing protein [Leptospiraceae bacterium]HMZ35239.1 DUF4136 domain-containing protein [Leptospiraceae bacterium]HNL69802.1 DUF4136 domain-containing protein [Leptospiraceae bacterium]